MEEGQESKPIEKEEKPKGPGIFSRLKNRLVRYRRVLNVSVKPTRSEFLSSAKITGAGIVLLGFIGFVIFMMYIILKYFIVI